MQRTESIDNQEMRRRRLRYRAWHRGTREMDFVLGRFADAELGALNENELAQFEALIDLPDPDLFAWITGLEAAPAEVDTQLFRRLSEFHRGGRGSFPR